MPATLIGTGGSINICDQFNRKTHWKQTKVIFLTFKPKFIIRSFFTWSSWWCHQRLTIFSTFEKLWNRAVRRDVKNISPLPLLIMSHWQYPRLLKNIKVFWKVMIVLIELQIYAKNYVGFWHETNTFSITIIFLHKFLSHSAFQRIKKG